MSDQETRNVKTWLLTLPLQSRLELVGELHLCCKPLKHLRHSDEAVKDMDKTSGGADLLSKGRSHKSRSHTLSNDTQSRVPPFEYRKS